MNMQAWGSVQLRCVETEVEGLKEELSGKHYCWELSKSLDSNVYTFNIFIIANMTKGTVEPA